MALPDKSFVLKIHALMQADGRFFLDNDALQANDTFLIRRFRPALSGTLFSIVDYRLLPEFAGTVHDPGRVRRSAPAGMAAAAHRQIQGADRPGALAGRRRPAACSSAALDQNLSSTRDIGVQLWGDVAGGIVHYVIGVFNGAPEAIRSPTPTSITPRISMGRLFFHPFRPESLQGLRQPRLRALGGHRQPQGAAAHRDRGGCRPGLAPFRTAGQNTFFQYLAPATDTTGALTTFTHERSTTPQPAALLLLRLVRPAGRVPVAEAGRAEGERHHPS